METKGWSTLSSLRVAPFSSTEPALCVRLFFVQTPSHWHDGRVSKRDALDDGPCQARGPLISPEKAALDAQNRQICEERGAHLRAEHATHGDARELRDFGKRARLAFRAASSPSMTPIGRPA
eukprot:2767695-Pleurochrysis_carterae.AAC.5